MRLRAIELEGFRSFREHERVELAGLTMTAVIGANHQGKTTLISHAIEYALYGGKTGASVSDAISRGQDKATVTVEFDLGDVTYRITRTRSRKGRNAHEVYVSVSDPSAENGWRSLEEKYSSTGGDPFIVHLLGMDLPTARATWLITQGNSGSFCEMDPSPRRAVLASAFGLDSFTPLEQAAEQHRKTAQMALTKAEYDRDSLTMRRESLVGHDSFPEIKTEELETEAKQAEAEADKVTTALAALEDPELEGRAKEARETLAAFDSDHSRELARFEQDKGRVERDLSEARSRLDQARGEREGAEDAVFGVDDAQAVLERAREAVKQAEENISSMRGKVSEYEAERAAAESVKSSTTTQAEEITERIESLKVSAQKGSGQCFTCGQPLTSKQAEDLISQQERRKDELRQTYCDHRDQGATAEQQAQQIRQQGSALEADLSGARAQERSADKALAEITKRASDVDLWTERENGMKTRVGALEEEFLAIGKPPQVDAKRRSTLTKAVEKVETSLKAATGDAEQKRAMTAQREEHRTRARSLWREQQRREQVAAELVSLEEPLAKATDAVEQHAKDVGAYTVLQNAFRPSGIPAMILAGVIEELNDEANDILSVMGSEKGVLVTAQKENQKGGMQDKVMVYAITPDGPVDYATLSGQEKYFIALALRMGLAECVARRTGTPIETIVQDEGWGTLDEQSRASVLEALTRMSQRFSIYSVTHITEIKESFPTVIEVSAGSGTSRAVVSTR